MNKRKVLFWVTIFVGSLVLVTAVSALWTSERVERWRLSRLTTKQLTELAERREMDPLVWEYLGRRLRAERRHEEELMAFAKSVALDPKVAQTHADLGKALAQNGKIFQAVYELEYALQLDPQLASAHFALGNLSMNQQLWRKAIDHLQATVKQQPQNQRAWFLLATCYGKVHESPTKRAILERLTREHPDNATYQKQLAYEYLFFNQFSRAEACARRALQTKPKDDEARYILGRALAEQANTPDEFDAAKRELDAALKAQPNDPHGHLAMGILRYRQGDYAKAASALEKSLALGVPETKAKMYLGQTYLRLGKQREGKFLLDVYRREGEILRETRQLELHLSNKPSDVNMRLKLAKLFLQVGRVAPAVQQLQIVLQMQPNHPEASRLLKTLQQ